MAVSKSQFNIEEPVISLSQQKQIKLKEFREFLVNKNVLLGYVKCSSSAFTILIMTSFIGLKIGSDITRRSYGCS